MPRTATNDLALGRSRSRRVGVSHTLPRSSRGGCSAWRLILMLAEGDSYSSICAALRCSPNYVSLWKGRFVAEGLSGLHARHRGRQVEKRTPALEARILEWTRRGPTDGSTHWSTRRLAKKLGVAHMMVARVWAHAGLKPHRIERYMASDDPNFEAKAADVAAVIGWRGPAGG